MTGHAALVGIERRDAGLDLVPGSAVVELENPMASVSGLDEIFRRAGGKDSCGSSSCSCGV
jgi:hypothetical protein